MQKNLKVSFYGYHSPLSGYGIASNNWVKYLSRRGVDVSVSDDFKPYKGSQEWEYLDDEMKAIYAKPFVRERIGLCEANPFNLHINKSEVRVAITMSESDHVAQSWADILNTMNYIVVPTVFQKQVFYESGVKTPIKIITHGVDTDVFSYYERPKRSVFTFGTLGYFDHVNRKGALDVIQAFASEFDNNENVNLILKSSDPSFEYYRNFKDNRIFLYSHNMTKHEVAQFYQAIDCFVFPSKAEGVGYPPREAMATGLPTIVTNYSGLEEIALPGVSYPLNHLTLEKRPDFIEQDGNWAVPDIQEIMFHMRSVYENQEEARRIGKHASYFIKSAHSMDHAINRLIQLLEVL